MPERRIGLIPSAWTASRSGSGEGGETCALLVTDRRIIVAFDAPQTKMKVAFKELFLKDPEDPPTPRQQLDLATMDIDVLAKMNDNVVIPFVEIKEFFIRTFMGRTGFRVKVTPGSGLEGIFEVDFVAPPELVKKRKAEGVSAKETKRQYTAKCLEVFRKALPSALALGVRWDA